MYSPGSTKNCILVVSLEGPSGRQTYIRLTETPIETVAYLGTHFSEYEYEKSIKCIMCTGMSAQTFYIHLYSTDGQPSDTCRNSSVYFVSESICVCV